VSQSGAGHHVRKRFLIQAPIEIGPAALNRIVVSVTLPLERLSMNRRRFVTVTAVGAGSALLAKGAALGEPAILGKLRVEEGEPPVPGAKWHIAEAAGDGVAFQFPKGSLADAACVTSAMLLDGMELAVFAIVLREWASVYNGRDPEKLGAKVSEPDYSRRTAQYRSRTGNDHHFPHTRMAEGGMAVRRYNPSAPRRRWSAYPMDRPCFRQPGQPISDDTLSARLESGLAVSASSSRVMPNSWPERFPRPVPHPGH
jgi:hypothetical protein